MALPYGGGDFRGPGGGGGGGYGGGGGGGAMGPGAGATRLNMPGFTRGVPNLKKKNWWEQFPGMNPEPYNPGQPGFMKHRYASIPNERIQQISDRSLALRGWSPATMQGLSTGYGVGAVPDYLKKLLAARGVVY